MFIVRNPFCIFTNKCNKGLFNLIKKSCFLFKLLVSKDSNMVWALSLFPDSLYCRPIENLFISKYFFNELLEDANVSYLFKSMKALLLVFVLDNLLSVCKLWMAVTLL